MPKFLPFLLVAALGNICYHLGQKSLHGETAHPMLMLSIYYGIAMLLCLLAFAFWGKTELAAAVDEIAERIRALGHLAPGSYTEFAKLSSIKDGDNTKSANEMIKDLAEGQEAVVRTCREIFPAADEAHDEPTADLLTTRMQLHEKNAWMLRSLLEK